MRIYLNNRFVPEKKARVSVFDHGFLYGDGVFETVRAYQGAFFRLDDHLRRLATSAEKLQIRLSRSVHVLDHLLYRTLSVNHIEDALLRIGISRGPGRIGLDPSFCPKPTLVIIPRIFKGCPAHQYRIGLKAAVVSVRRVPPQALEPAIKSTNYLNNILAKILAKQMRADEGFMLSLDGYLTEGSVSNIFFVKRRRLFTPDVRSGLLAGITRGVVLELAEQAGFKVREAFLKPSDLYKADECFLTNTSLEMMPVVEVDGNTIGEGKPGPVTRFLHEAYRERVRLECKGS